MDTNYSYLRFHEARDPHLAVEVIEYAEMVRNLGKFMNRMLDNLKQDERLMGKAVRFRKWKLFAFFVLLLGSSAGVVFLAHPGWIAFSVFCGIVMGVAVLAVPITYWQDKRIYMRKRNIFIQEVKSYYMFQYSIMRQASGYDNYIQLVGGSDTDVFLKYMEKYAP